MLSQWDELLRETGKGKTAILREWGCLIEKNEVLNLRQGFYLILTPRYSSFGKLPINLYIHKFCEYLLQHISRKDGKVVLEKEVTTATAPAVLELTADRDQIHVNGKDLWYIIRYLEVMILSISIFVIILKF